MCALFAGGILTGVVIDRSWTGMGEKREPIVEKREGGYTFINPLLECSGPREIFGDWEFLPFREMIETFVKDAVKKKRASHVSIYFRDLTNGPVFGMNMEERFSPASLLKVPLMIAYLKMAESQPALLKKELAYDGNQDLNRAKSFKGSRAIEPGKRYTVEELIRMMIVYSDNNAMRLLFTHMDQGFREEVYRDLGIVDRTGTGDYILSVEEYAFCFRVLFNATYLNREMSEQALRYLAQPDFPFGIIGGVPPGIIVAQKYGERVRDKINDKELHDCGIVYYPNMPYLLCVMTKGEDYRVLAEMTKDLSAMFYYEVNGNHVALQAKKSKQR